MLNCMYVVPIFLYQFKGVNWPLFYKNKKREDSLLLYCIST